jgi:hypothetical protein
MATRHLVALASAALVARPAAAFPSYRDLIPNGLHVPQVRPLLRLNSA